MSSAGAALELSSNLRVPLELWLSAGRAEGGGEYVIGAVQEMLTGLPNVKLVMNGWQTWPNFRKTIAHMHLLMQPSYTESFNMVTADGVAEGVASVVSDAIDWAPDDWKANVDDVLEIARVHAACCAIRAPLKTATMPFGATTRTASAPTEQYLSLVNQHAVAV